MASLTARPSPLTAVATRLDACVGTDDGGGAASPPGSPRGGRTFDSVSGVLKPRGGGGGEAAGALRGVGSLSAPASSSRAVTALATCVGAQVEAGVLQQ